MGLKEILSIIFISSGTFFMFVGSLGLIRLPDFYSRAHATGAEISASRTKKLLSRL